MKKTIIFLLFVCFPMLFIACNEDKISPGGIIKTENRDVGAFTGVEVSDGIKVVIVPNTENSLQVKADVNLVDKIETYISGETLIVKMEDHVSIKGSPALQVFIGAENLKKLDGNGGSSVNLSGELHGDTFSLNLSGGARSEGRVEVGHFELKLSGGSRAEYSGTAGFLELTCSGGSPSRGFDLVATDAEIDLSGGSSAEHTIHGTIKLRASGGSNFRYKGAGTLRISEISGGSSVQHID